MSIVKFTGKLTGKMVSATKSAPSNTKSKVSTWKFNFQDGYNSQITDKKKGKESVLDTDLPV